MNFFRRALISIIRNKSKSTLFFLLAFILGSLTAATLLTNRASIQAQQNVINNMRPQAILGRDWYTITRVAITGTYFSWRPIVQPISIELIHEIASLSYVKEHYYYLVRQLFSFEVEKYMPGIYYFHTTGAETELGCIYYIRGVQRPNLTDVEQNLIEITSGRTFTDEEIEQSLPVAIISESLARKNQLGIGSVISLRSVLFNPHQIICMRYFREENILGSLFYDVEIVGTFSIITDVASPFVSDNTNWWTLSDVYNRIYVPSGFVAQISEEKHILAKNIGFHDIIAELEAIDLHELSWDEGFDLHGGLYKASYLNFTLVETFFELYHPDYMTPFLEAAEPLLPEYHTIHFADNNFQEILLAFESLESISAILLYITLGAIALIFYLLVTFIVRSRIYEMGIYLAVGVRKINIALQVVLEMLIIAIPALILALLIGYIFGSEISEDMLMNELLVIEEIGREWPSFDLFYRAGLGGGQMTVNALLANYENTLTLGVALLFFIVSIVTILISTLIPLIYAFHIKSKEILMFMR